MRPNRREALQVFGAVAVPWGLGLYAKQAHAGAQIEEPLSAAVRTALAAANDELRQRLGPDGSAWTSRGTGTSTLTRV